MVPSPPSLRELVKQDHVAYISTYELRGRQMIVMRMADGEPAWLPEDLSTIDLFSVDFAHYRRGMFGLSLQRTPSLKWNIVTNMVMGLGSDKGKIKACQTPYVSDDKKRKMYQALKNAELITEAEYDSLTAKFTDVLENFVEEE